MDSMRIRILELMAAHKPPLTTAYQLAEASDGALTMTTAYRLVNYQGRPHRIELGTLEVLCHTFRVTPDKLLEMDEPLQRKAG